jgi:cytochrome c oxidase cbb3-type subunit 4
MTYETLAAFAQNWGTIFFIVAFCLVLAYALNPKNGPQFDDAARLPLEKD